MEYAALGASGLVVSRAAFGAMTFGNQFSPLAGFSDGALPARLVGKALDAGITLFDTADVYHGGQSEEILGSALGKRRDDIVLMTKAGMRSSPATLDGGLSSRHLHLSIDKSLRRLGTDWVDVYVCHRPDLRVPLEETLAALDRIVTAGKSRYLGFSNWPAWLVATAIEMQHANGWARFVTGQMYYSLATRDIEHDYVPMADYHRIGTTVWSPLAGGYLTGKYRSDPSGGNGRLSRMNLIPPVPSNGEQIVDALTVVAERHSTTPSAVAIAWVISRRFVGSVIVGFSSEDQLDANLAATGIRLSEDDLGQLDAVSRPVTPYPQNWMPTFTADPVFDNLHPRGRHESGPSTLPGLAVVHVNE